MLSYVVDYELIHVVAGRMVERMTLLAYTGLVLTLATIHEYVPYTPSVILILILLGLVYKISRLVLVSLYLEVLVFCLVLKLSSSVEFIPLVFMLIIVTNRIVCLIIIAAITSNLGNDRIYNYI